MAWIMTKGAPWSKKWQIMTIAHVDVKTTDGYLLKVGMVLLKNKQTNKTPQSDSEDLLCSAPNPEDGNHDLRDADK